MIVMPTSLQFALQLHLVLATVLLISSLSRAQLGSPDNSQIYDGPYLQVYPPVDISIDQQSCSPTNNSNGSCPLYIALISSFGGDYTSSGTIPGVQIALDQINADPSMLPGYTLHYTLTNSNCHRTTALDALTTQLFQPPYKIGIIGSGCSVATEPTAEVSHYYNVTHLSCASSSTELANRAQFRYYFQLLASEADLAFGFFGIIKKFEWRRVAIITQEENLFSVTMDRLKDLLSQHGIDYTESRFRSDEGVESLGDNPFDPDSRIFILAMYSTRARQIMCKAHQHGVRYPRHLFLVYGWYSNNWWIGSQEEQDMLMSEYGCSVANREAILPATLAPLQSEFISDVGEMADNGINGSVFLTNYGLYTKQHPLNLSEIVYSQHCYDATWTLAYAINSTITEIGGNQSFQEELAKYNPDLFTADEFGLHHFTYNNTGVLKAIFSSIEGKTFNGITGRVKFNKSDGVRRVNDTAIFSYQYVTDNKGKRLEIRPVANINFTNRSNFVFTYINEYRESDLWNERPYDGVPNEEIVTVALTLSVVFISLSVAGIIFAIVCLLFNFIFRNRKLIRLSSPNLNYLIGVGAIVIYLDVISYVIPTTNSTTVLVLSNLNTWLTAFAYSLCYGTLLVKMFRVYYIFNSPSPTKNWIIQDWMLALGVLILLVIDFIILITYTVVEGISGHLDAKRVSNRENPDNVTGDLAVIYQYFIYICDSTTRDITLGFLYGYKGLLQVVALILAFSIRKVKVKGLNDAKYVALAIYVTSIVTAVVIVCTHTLKDYINGYASVISSGFFIGTTVILVLVFIPKMLNLYNDPQGELVFSKSEAGNLRSGPENTHSKYVSNHGKLSCVSFDNGLFDGDKSSIIEELRSKVKELEHELLNKNEGHINYKKSLVSKAVTFDDVESFQTMLNVNSNEVNDVVIPETRDGISRSSDEADMNTD